MPKCFSCSLDDLDSLATLAEEAKAEEKAIEQIEKKSITAGMIVILAILAGIFAFRGDKK